MICSCGHEFEVADAEPLTHKLLVGDSTKGEDVERVMGGAVPFIMVTDPPYGVEYDPAWRNDASQAGRGLGPPCARAEGRVQNDDKADWGPAYELFKGDVAYVWHASLHGATVDRGLVGANFEARSVLIWRKAHFAISRGHYHWQHEMCFYAVRIGKTSRWCGDRSQSTVWDITHVANETGHGTQKPVECMARPIRNHGDASDDVYDPFLGSGTTMVAAEQLGRRCYGIEISPAYCGVILERLTNQGCKCSLPH